MIQHWQIYYSDALRYQDNTAGKLFARWLRLASVRPLLVNSSGEPLVHHDAPLRWAVTEPVEADGDYSVQLVRADGSPAPAIIAVFDGSPTLFLTAEGVFKGPPPQSRLLHFGQPTLIPAKAFETAGGLRLVEHLHVAPPPRLAARVRTVQLRPRIVAEVKQPWAERDTEYCQFEVLGVSSTNYSVRLKAIASKVCAPRRSLSFEWRSATSF